MDAVGGGLVVERVGSRALVVDRGRPGWAHIGVPPAGALDGPALALAHRLVGNPPDAAGMEVLLGDLAVRVTAACTVAVTGPPGPVTVRTGHRARAVGSHGPVHLAAGDRLDVGPPASGLRRYVAVAGGIAVEPVLGSRSADTLSGLGPAPLGAGTRLPVGPAPGPGAGTATAPVSVVPAHRDLAVRPGPRDDWFTDAAAELRDTTWTVGADGDRVGVRLAGTPLTRAPGFADRELPSEGLVTGAVQVPPDGRPVVFLADHPVTGGYPVVAVLDPTDLPAAAQARPGSTLRLVPIR